MNSSARNTRAKKGRSLWFWILAVLITLASAYYQRKTGPTYPISGEMKAGTTSVSYTFSRSHAGEGGAPVRVTIPDTMVTATLDWRRYPTDDAWKQIPMHRDGDQLSASLPHQPPAGKVEYYVRLQVGDRHDLVPPGRAAVLRFRGDVPAVLMSPHILLMFLAMLFSTRAGLAALTRNEKTGNYVAWTAGLTLVGGMILGPIVQFYAFGSFWTGAPLGWDLTDNKTLIAMVGWILAFIKTRNNRPARGWVLGASILMLIIFLIPHSVLGSQLDYAKFAGHE
ncbi:MAG: hypothetical protein FJY66_01825 [Calditrichaeota bacterium]|nr:hypothetical protein [Calditrichota bacterium]